MIAGLFRREVIEARAALGQGPVSLAQPPGRWLMALVAVAAAAALVAFLCWGEYTRRTRVAGQLVPRAGLVTLPATQAGVLSEVRVREGDPVTRGDTLAVIRSLEATHQGDTAARIALAQDRRGCAIDQGHRSQAQQARALAEGLRRQRAAAAAEQAQLALAAAARARQLQIARATLERMRRLHGERFVTELQLLQQEDAVLEHQALQASLGRDLAALGRQLAQLDQEIAALPSRLAALEAARQRENAMLQLERAEQQSRREGVLVSPVDGVVTALLGLPGQAVQPGQPLVAVLPRGSPLEAHLLVPSRAAGFIAAGDAVLLRFDAFPYQKFGQARGRVARISRSTVGSRSAAVGNAADEPVYRVVVVLERDSVTAFGVQEPLRPGMALEADILGERRRLVEWLLEPLYSVSGRL